MALLENLGFVVEVNGQGKVVGQSIHAGTFTGKGTKVALELSRS